MYQIRWYPCLGLLIMRLAWRCIFGVILRIILGLYLHKTFPNDMAVQIRMLHLISCLGPSANDRLRVCASLDNLSFGYSTRFRWPCAMIENRTLENTRGYQNSGYDGWYELILERREFLLRPEDPFSQTHGYDGVRNLSSSPGRQYSGLRLLLPSGH